MLELSFALLLLSAFTCELLFSLLLFPSLEAKRVIFSLLLILWLTLEVLFDVVFKLIAPGIITGNAAAHIIVSNFALFIKKSLHKCKTMLSLETNSFFINNNTLGYYFQPCHYPYISI